jgi:hypothetical protein
VHGVDDNVIVLIKLYVRCVCVNVYIFGEDVGGYRNVIWSITAIQDLFTSHSIQIRLV